MIYINESKHLIDNQYIIQVPINESIYFRQNKFTLLNLQSKEVVSFTELYNMAQFSGYYEFYLNLQDVNIPNGTYYYQVFGVHDDEENTEKIITTGLCKVEIKNESDDDEKDLQYINKNDNKNIVYRG